MKKTISSLFVSIALCAAMVFSCLPAHADDNRDIGVTDLVFLPQGDGTVAVQVDITIKQLGTYGFHLTVEHYRDGQKIGTIKEGQYTDSASGCGGIESCPEGQTICAGTCMIGSSIWGGYHGSCEASGCCYPGGPNDCRYFRYCMGMVSIVGSADLQVGDSVKATITPDVTPDVGTTITPDVGTVDADFINNTRSEVY
ncbi:MAG: hypothetical protein Q9Q40_03775 [Acidobacteriota bacterium]|nr:hypothetical protein [Acidobacteriota bacterium]